MRRVHSTIPITLTACLLLSACATYTPPEIDYDSDVPALPAPPPPVVEEPLRAIHTDQRTYLLELRANETSYMASVAWSYPPGRAQPRPPSIQQPAMPPLFVLGADGRAERVNTRVFRNVLIVDGLLTAELRLGSDDQQVVKIVRTDRRPRP